MSRSIEEDYNVAVIAVPIEDGQDGRVHRWQWEGWGQQERMIAQQMVPSSSGGGQRHAGERCSVVGV